MTQRESLTTVSWKEIIDKINCGLELSCQMTIWSYRLNKLIYLNENFWVYIACIIYTFGSSPNGGTNGITQHFLVCVK